MRTLKRDDLLRGEARKSRHVAMLARKITNLTSLGLRGITRRACTAVLRVKVATGRVAAAISRD
jgi:hypothetical protein